MAAPNKLAALNKYRSAGSAMPRPVQVKVLVVYDVQIKDVPQVPLIVNYGMFYSLLSRPSLTHFCRPSKGR